MDFNCTLKMDFEKKVGTDSEEFTLFILALSEKEYTSAKYKIKTCLLGKTFELLNIPLCR